MSLETGLYFIQAKSTHYNVGRYYVEDRSLLPKRVLSLSQAVGGLPSEWLVEKTGDRTYRMKAQDAYTGVIDDKLYAFLLPEPAPVDWVIKAHPEHGDNVYSIETESGEGWTVEGQSESQIEIHAFQDSPNQLFTLVQSKA
ncbi:hypothetical protein TWF225_010463 [Orbilia oligospora]|nr:hypothetical protein TWF225_010463 [Orbilia oligospora]KAF3237103.1 hypothetical protein TWF128_001173 [Orbilia oligospora]KAF3257324.1 hypothetical protein TWF217_006064 [Orbilia oligospora]KAF3283592.1 hypothetical protein TWF132_010042 [Orbilia oligospora]